MYKKVYWHSFLIADISREYIKIILGITSIDGWNSSFVIHSAECFTIKGASIKNYRLICEQLKNVAKTFYSVDCSNTSNVFDRIVFSKKPNFSNFVEFFFFSCRITRKRHILPENICCVFIFKNDYLFIKSCSIYCQQLGCLNFWCIEQMW